MNNAVSRFQKGEARTIERSEIHGAPYNPRVIDEAARKRLMKAIKQDGLIGPLVWNEQTGNIVSGHQRLDILDQLEKSQDYALAVTVISVDERKEKALNVQFNNPSMQGDWDVEALANLVADDGLGFEELGFSEADAQVLFGGDSRLADLFQDDEGVTEAKGKLADIKKERGEATERLKKEQSADFMVTLVCENRDQKVALCKALRIPEYEQFAPAADVMRRLGGS
jgi:ParB-like chromosome segregation protein Spo0J